MKFRINYKGILLVLGTIVYFFFLVSGVETLLNGTYEETTAWRDENRKAFFFNIMIVFSLFIIFLGIFNRYVVSFIVTNAVVLFIATMSYYKFSFLGEFLYPWDMMLYNNVLNLLPNLYKEVNFGQVVAVVLGIIIIIAALAAYFILKKPKRLIRLPIWMRLIFVGMGVAYLSVFIFYRSIPNVETSLQLAGVTNLTFDQNRNYKTNGFYLTFLLNMQSAIVLKPNGYNEKNIMEIVDRLSEEKTEPEKLSTEKPNIIFVMNESFWDPTLMENVEFDPDPMPVIREHQSGKILSSTYGGGTSNVEFEALTGFSNMFLPVGSVPYQQYIQEELPAMPNYLAGSGYQTTAIHPYAKWFWNRESVYQHLGFEQFIDIDVFEDPLYKGPFVSDEQVSTSIIEQTEQNEEPTFIYAITMQNHTGYNEDKYEEFDVKTQTPPSVDPVFNLLLRSFTQGIYDADKAFKQLIDYYETSDEPTLIVFFGDHLPAIGHDYKLFKQADFVPRGAGEENWELEDYLKTRTTPLVFWNNYGVETPEPGTISPSFLGPAVLGMTGIEKPLYYEVLDNFKELMPGFTQDLKIDANGDLFKVTPDEVENAKRDYELIQYDLMFGEQYSRDRLFGE